MCQDALHGAGVRIVPMGSMSTYRTYVQQLWLWDHVSHPHNTAWVARPGSSNHGWAIAVDLGDGGRGRMRWAVDRYGARYGIAKRWSDAPIEPWHIKVRTDIGSAPKPRFQLPTIKKGYVEPRKYTKLLQRLMWRAGLRRFKINGRYDLATRQAVRRFQHKHVLKADGVVGPTTWTALAKAAR